MGISVAVDGSEDKEINIDGLVGYQVQDDEEDSDCTDEEDPFADSNDDADSDDDDL